MEKSENNQEEFESIVKLDRIAFIQDLLEMNLLISPNFNINNENTSSDVYKPISTSLGRFLKLLMEMLNKQEIEINNIELIGSTVRSILFGNKENIDFFDIDLSIRINCDRFDDVLRAEESTLLELCKQQSISVSREEIPLYFLNKTLVGEPFPWALISVGSLECTVDIKVSCVEALCDFSVNSLKIQLKELIEKTTDCTAIIPVTSSFPIDIAIKDIHNKIIRWKDISLRRIGLRYVLMKVKGYELENKKDVSLFGENIVSEFFDKPHDYFKNEVLKFVQRHFYKDGFDFGLIFQFLDVLKNTVLSFQNPSLLITEIEKIKIMFELFQKQGRRNERYHEE